MIRIAGYILLGSLAAQLAGTEPAKAFELFGIHLFGSQSTKTGSDIVDPKTFDVTFTVVPDDSVEDAVKGASQLWVQRDEAAGGSAGLLALAKGDYRRILSALYNDGRYGGSISITVNGAEAAQIPVGTEMPEMSEIVVTVNPGPQFLFGQTVIENTAPPPVSDKDRVAVPAEEGFAPGEPARASAIRRAEELAKDAWRQQGHPKAIVDNRTVTANHPAARVDVRMHADPGPKAYYGQVEVRGTQRMDREFVRWMLGIEPGVEYDPDDLERGRKRLRRLEVFSTQNLAEAETVGDNGILPLTLTVSERKLRRIGVGATASTDEGFGAEAFWLHRNLFGRAESVRITGKISGIGQSGSFDEIDYFLGATFRKPGFATRDTDLVAETHGSREMVETYTKTSAGGSVFLEHFFSDEITGRAGVFMDHGRFKDAFGTRNFTTTGLVGGLTADRRDNRLDASSGYYADLDVRPFHEWQFGNSGVRSVADVRGYYAPGEGDRLVAAARVKAGVLAGPSIAETPPDLLFFAGGGGSVRGYGYKTIGVAGPGGDIVGGRSLLELSGELRFKATDNVGIVGFLDAGAVGSDSFDFVADGLRAGAGLGLRYYTSLGPIRLDVGFPLDPGPGDPSFAVYAGIGQAF